MNAQSTITAQQLATATIQTTFSTTSQPTQTAQTELPPITKAVPQPNSELTQSTKTAAIQSTIITQSAFTTTAHSTNRVKTTTVSQPISTALSTTSNPTSETTTRTTITMQPTTHLAQPTSTIQAAFVSANKSTTTTQTTTHLTIPPNTINTQSTATTTSQQMYIKPAFTNQISTHLSIVTTQLTSAATQPTTNAIQPSNLPLFPASTVTQPMLTITSKPTATSPSLANTVQPITTTTLVTMASTQPATSPIPAPTSEPKTTAANLISKINTLTARPTHLASTTTTSSPLLETTAPLTTTVEVRFSSSETFDPLLSDRNSDLYKKREQRVKNEFHPIFKKVFHFFFGLTVIRFSSGSVITYINLQFNKNSILPSDNEIISTIINATTTFNITSAEVVTVLTTTVKPTTTPTTKAKTTTPTTKATSTTPTTKATSTTPTTKATSTTPTTKATSTTPTTKAKTTMPTTKAKTTTATTKATTTMLTTTTTTTKATTTTPKAKATTTTTTTTTTTAVPTRPPPVVTIELVILIVFTTDLQNTQSAAFKNLAEKVQNECDKVYKQKYGNLFIRTVVIAFRAFARTRAEENVQAELELVFSQTSTEPIPSNSDIVQTLKEAAATPTSGFNLTIDVTSIVVIKSVKIIPLIILTNGTFVAALTNKSSTEFVIWSLLIKTGLEPFFFADYPTSFSTLSLTNVSEARVKSRSVPTLRNSMDLTFGADAVLPSSTQIVNTVVRAARNNTLPFQIFTFSIVVNGTEYSSGEVSSRISVLTASVLVAVSLLVQRFN
ncbi:integumentary mucin C.1-like [Puntigrus tetrazona]|uniref:integumentary mucin C.1-like n=1 Tax=Puntigrus tetrazona TaxID=1606681 RepID=UPI001C8A598B|nr:integumentary mucin C.1-like [Puntigrus tetrazona]